MGLAFPFAEQPGARLKLALWRLRQAAFLFDSGRNLLQPFDRGRFQSTIHPLLNLVGNTAQQQIAADLARCRPLIELGPLGAQIRRAEFCQFIEMRFELRVIPEHRQVSHLQKEIRRLPAAARPRFVRGRARGSGIRHQSPARAASDTDSRLRPLCPSRRRSDVIGAAAGGHA